MFEGCVKVTLYC